MKYTTRAGKYHFRVVSCFMRAPCAHHFCSCLRRESSRHGVTGNSGLRAMRAFRTQTEISGARFHRAGHVKKVPHVRKTTVNSAPVLSSAEYWSPQGRPTVFSQKNAHIVQIENGRGSNTV